MLYLKRLTMAKSHKPLNETSSVNRLCLKCFNCRTQTFRNLKKLASFCEERECHFNLTWKRRLFKDKKVKLYWCTIARSGPRIFRACDTPFISNCKHFNGGIDGTA